LQKLDYLVYLPRQDKLFLTFFKTPGRRRYMGLASSIV